MNLKRLPSFFPHFFDLIRDANLHRALRICDRWKFQDGDELLWLAMRPAVAAFGLWVSSQIENFNVTLPKRLAAKDFFHRHSSDVFGVSLVQVKYDLL